MKTHIKRALFGASLAVVVLLSWFACKSDKLHFAADGDLAGGPRQHPNVLIFLMDDMGFGDAKVLNPEGCGFDTPNIDKMAADGISFQHAHSSAALCAPSRYALLTGNHVYRGRLPQGAWSRMNGSQILEGQQTLADVLRAEGYATAFFGKGHLGSRVLNKSGQFAASFANVDLSKRFDDGPRDHGFDYSLILPAGIQSEPYAFFRNDRFARWDDKTKDFHHFDTDEMARQHVNEESDEFEVDNWDISATGPLLMRDALGYIDKHVEEHGKKKPFFLYYASQAGHRPHKPPEAFNVNDPMNTTDVTQEGAVRVKGQTVNHRTDMIYEGDVALGLFLRKLKQKGILENTLVIFTSDNGAAEPVPDSSGPKATWSNPIYRAGNKRRYGGDRTEEGFNGKKHVNGQGVAPNGDPLRGRKIMVYEGGHRVPLLVQWGDRISGGHHIGDQLIGLHDVFRTVATIVGAEPGRDQGRDSYDFSQVWLKPSATQPLVRDRLFVQTNRRPQTELDGPITWTWAVYSPERVQGQEMRLWKAIVRNEARFMFKKEPKGAVAFELFELSQDPSEATSLPNESMRKELETSFREDLVEERTAPVD